ncbi:MAG: AraC family transcriptional regulator, partial [bacterium]|nr:AraC family transcriptional regulator [bacterium]
LEPYFYQTVTFKLVLLVMVVFVVGVVIQFSRKRFSLSIKKESPKKSGDSVKEAPQLKEGPVGTETPLKKGEGQKVEASPKVEAEKPGKQPKYKGFHLEDAYAEECIKKLMHQVEVKKVYRDADITLEKLADRLSIPRHVLSRILNERLKRNFSDYINYYRIEEARRILSTAEGAKRKNTIVAFDVGFNTATAFYKAFKKFTGKTPKEYRQEMGTKK